MLAVFQLMENNPGGQDADHGRTGPLPARRLTGGGLTPPQAGFTGAAAAHGVTRVRGFNGAGQDGAGGHPGTVVNGIGQNAAVVFLTAGARRRPSRATRGDVTTGRVLAGGTAGTGGLAADGAVYRVGEVILPAGRYGSPAILRRCGTGPAGELTALGTGWITRPSTPPTRPLPGTCR